MPVAFQADSSNFAFLFSPPWLNFFQIWIHAVREGPPEAGVECVWCFFGDQGLCFWQEKKNQTFNTLMVFFIVFLFTYSDEKTFFIVILKSTKVHVPLNELNLLTEFTTRGQSPMQASICFASIAVVLLKIIIQEKCILKMWKVYVPFSLKQRSKGTTFIPEYSAWSLPR